MTDANKGYVRFENGKPIGAARPPTEEELRDALDNAPVAPNEEGQDDDRTDDTRQTKGGEENGRKSGPGSGAKVVSANTSGGDRGGGRRGERAVGEIFDDCPVTPLGVRGPHAFYLDVNGQMRSVTKHDRETILSLFGHMNPRLNYKFPVWRKNAEGEMERKPRAFDQGDAAWVMYAAASECGVFDPANSVRGVGAWTDDDGNLVYHTGDALLINGERHKPGKLGKHIYPAQPPIPHPHASDTPTDPVPEIQRTLATWNWAAADVHPHIALGMIGVLMLGGALDWRPVFWMVAPAASGKSEFQRLLKLLHGDDGLIQTTNTTKSGITSQIGQSSLPVAVDELEPGDERSTKERDIIELARVAASGGKWFRGSADQTGISGNVYSAFFFSSILIPGVMKTQDVQRLVRLELKPLGQHVPKLALDPRTWRTRGAKLKQLLIDRWPSWPERMSAWRHSLEEAGVGGRNADKWGTVLAMADMAIQADIAPADVRAAWADKIAFIANADRDDTVNDADAMLLHLMGQQFDPFRRGQQYSIAQWIMAACGLPSMPEGLRHEDERNERSSLHDTSKRANQMLASLGMRVDGRDVDGQLFIANKQIPNLLKLFHGSDWAGGVWKQSAMRVPGAIASPNPKRLAGIASRGTLIPIKSIPGLIGMPMDQARVAGTDADGVASATDADDWS